MTATEFANFSLLIGRNQGTPHHDKESGNCSLFKLKGIWEVIIKIFQKLVGDSLSLQNSKLIFSIFL